MKTTNEMNRVFELLRQGDKSGLEFLYDVHYNKMYGIAFSISKNRMMSEDAAHNVMYKFMSLDAIQFPTDHEFSWLYTVVKNETLMLMRKQKDSVSFESISELGVQDKSIEEFVDLEKFYSIIAPLNEAQKEVVTLKILGNYTHKEIAEMLQKPLGTVLWLYNTSIKKLRVILTSVMSITVGFLSGLITRICLFFANLNQDSNPPNDGPADIKPGTPPITPPSPSITIPDWCISLIVAIAFALITILTTLICIKLKKRKNTNKNQD